MNSPESSRKVRGAKRVIMSKKGGGGREEGGERGSDHEKGRREEGKATA